MFAPKRVSGEGAAQGERSWGLLSGAPVGRAQRLRDPGSLRPSRAGSAPSGCVPGSASSLLLREVAGSCSDGDGARLPPCRSGGGRRRRSHALAFLGVVVFVCLYLLLSFRKTLPPPPEFYSFYKMRPGDIRRIHLLGLRLNPRGLASAKSRFLEGDSVLYGVRTLSRCFL